MIAIREIVKAGFAPSIVGKAVVWAADEPFLRGKLSTCRAVANMKSNLVSPYNAAESRKRHKAQRDEQETLFLGPVLTQSAKEAERRRERPLSDEEENARLDAIYRSNNPDEE